MTVFHSLGSPEFMRVCEKIHGGSKTIVKVSDRTTAFSDLFLHNLLIQLKLADAFFVGAYHGVILSLYDTIQQLFDLALSLIDLQLQGLAMAFLEGHTVIPEVSEHIFGQAKKLRRWFE
ncbi:hypothetical protein [Halioxenophilus sp. WMMB6]|uniref:hypothetical protein n=1 Tax=Halioxenophilus sp. WMMB6 TaxID=3073815 RepID=UPI00295F18CC|nr:hypothetical protein [Halioxenophilus sp. WMMB6]